MNSAHVGQRVIIACPSLGDNVNGSTATVVEVYRYPNSRPIDCRVELDSPIPGRYGPQFDYWLPLSFLTEAPAEPASDEQQEEQDTDHED